MFDAVRGGTSPYSEEQRAAWVSEPPKGWDWNARLGKQEIILAELNSEIAGFMSLAPDDYLDFAHILPAHRGTGLFRRLYNEIERLALERQCRRIWVHASLMAEPAFAGMGFTQLSKETVSLGSEQLDRFVMEKHLRHSDK